MSLPVSSATSGCKIPLRMQIDGNRRWFYIKSRAESCALAHFWFCLCDGNETVLSLPTWTLSVHASSLLSGEYYPQITLYASFDKHSKSLGMLYDALGLGFMLKFFSLWNTFWKFAKTYLCRKLGLFRHFSRLLLKQLYYNALIPWEGATRISSPVHRFGFSTTIILRDAVNTLFSHRKGLLELDN